MREVERATAFISAGESSTTMAELEDRFRTALLDFDVSNFSIILAAPRAGNQARRPIGVTKSVDPVWSAHYMDQKYYNSDPVVHTSLVQPGDFTWDELNLPARSDAARRQVAEGRDHLKVDGCLAIPVHDSRGYAGLVSMMYHGAELLAPRRFALKLMAIYAVEKAKELHHIEPDVGGWETSCPLTVRQRELLAYSAAGNTTSEIADILKISEKTAGHHFENALELLNVATRTQAVAVAIHRGWLQL